MVELALSLNWSLPDALAEALHSFEQRYGIGVRPRVLDHAQEKRQISGFAISGSGPDVSEVGTTWLSDLISMCALRDFSPWEVTALEREGAFFQPAWEPGVEKGTALAVPWRTDTRVIYYRRDLLRQAGIDDADAFSTIENLRQTLRRLQTVPGIVPCAISTDRHPMSLHLVAPWVWQAGGSFMRPDGRKTLFTEPQALSGIVNYLDTFAPVLAPELHGLSEGQATNCFVEGQAAVTITGHWLLDMLRGDPDLNPEVAANLGLALTPGAQYRGGMSLVIWQYSHHAREAFSLIRFLTSRDLQSTVLRQAGYLPARQKALHSPPFTTGEHYRVIGQSLQSGRGFAAAYMWGLVEEQLTTAIFELWQQLFDDPDLDLSAAVRAKLRPIAGRLDRSFARVR